MMVGCRNQVLFGALLGAFAVLQAAAVSLRSPRSLRAKRAVHHDSLLFTKQTIKHKARAAMMAKYKYGMDFSMEVVHKTAYWGTVTLGTPPQDFKVIFDTGSGNLIIPSAACNMPGCNCHKKYDKSTSTTASAVVNENGEGSSEITFGTGDITGDFFQDQFCLGSNLCHQISFIGSTEQSAEPFSETPFDGILGMGFKDLSMGKGFNIVDDFNDQGTLPQGQFSVYLSDEGSSEITFGGFRPELLASDIVWANVERPSYWQVGIDDITFNNEKTGLCDGGCQVAVDTGTSMLAGPTDLVNSLSEKINAKDDCSNFKDLPKLGFAIGDRVLNLAPDDYMDNDGGQCSFSLMALDVPPPKGPLFIFGDPFLRRFVTIYDRTGPKVGFAVAKHDGMDNAAAFDIISKVGGGVGNVGAPPMTGGEQATDVNLEGGLMTGEPQPSRNDDPPPAADAAAASTTSTDSSASAMTASTDASSASTTSTDSSASASSSATTASTDASSASSSSSDPWASYSAMTDSKDASSTTTTSSTDASSSTGSSTEASSWKAPEASSTPDSYTAWKAPQATTTDSSNSGSNTEDYMKYFTSGSTTSSSSDDASSATKTAAAAAPPSDSASDWLTKERAELFESQDPPKPRTFAEADAAITGASALQVRKHGRHPHRSAFVEQRSHMITKRALARNHLKAGQHLVSVKLHKAEKDAKKTAGKKL